MLCLHRGDVQTRIGPDSGNHNLCRRLKLGFPAVELFLRLKFLLRHCRIILLALRLGLCSRLNFHLLNLRISLNLCLLNLSVKLSFCLRRLNICLRPSLI